jgi:asparagine synthase (glutamine-hydrolysing)
LRDALSHRGPDDSRIEVFGNVGLVHTRLAIVDVSKRAHQPMFHPNRRWVLSFNGEIFNHASLRRRLSGATFQSGSDTETLLHSLGRWGMTVLPELNGQFALAALDFGSRRLFLARDRFGIKPLYYSESDEGVWFASEPAALLAAGITSTPQSDSWRLIDDGSCYSGTKTLLSTIQRLPPGTCAAIQLDTSHMANHRWDISAWHVNQGRQRHTRSRSRLSLVSELERTLRKAVHDALLGDVAIGTLCSGGIDSSLVAAFAVEKQSDLVAFAASYSGGGVLDEGPVAQRAADALNIELDLLKVTDSSWRSGFVKATLHFGAPLADASAVVIAQMAERARRQGIKVLLTGEGADELFGGYAKLHQRALSEFLPTSQQALQHLEPFLLDPSPRTLRLAAVKLMTLRRAATTAKPAWPHLIGPVADSGTEAELEAAYQHHSGARRILETALLVHLDHTLPHLLNRMDKNMMQAGVEARVPYLDPRVVDFVLNLPLETRVGPWTKGILRDVARRLLPWTVAHRPKFSGMDFDAGVWIDRAADPRFLIDGLLRDTLGVPAQEFADTLASARGAFRVRLWSTEVWCRSVFAGDSLADIEQELWPSGP